MVASKPVNEHGEWPPRPVRGLLVASITAVAIIGASLGVAQGAPPPGGCVTSEVGGTVVLEWDDQGGTHVIRRDGSWLATPGSNVSTYTDTSPPPDASYIIRTWANGGSSDRTCVPDGTPTTTTTTSTTSTTTTTTTTAPPPPPGGCVLTDNGTTVQLTWTDDGGTHVIRRNNSWLATPGANTSTFTDTSPIPGATYVVRTWQNGSTDRVCSPAGPPPTTTTTTAPPPPPGATAERVVHVSIDGLRADHVTPSIMPRLSGLIASGASTLNARTVPSATQTLQNHTSQFTSRAVEGPGGHGVDYNTDIGATVHQEAGQYVASIFDVVHDNGGTTVLLAGKSKFDMMERNWNLNGAPDITGPDDGTEKIDLYDRVPPETSIDLFVDFLEPAPAPSFGFYHIRNADNTGHVSNWSSPQYQAAVTASDAILGDLVDEFAARGLLPTTTFIVTSDHGGPAGQSLHNDNTLADNYTVPMVIYGPGASPGTDLYALNSDDRTDPGTSLVGLTGPQPIRTGEMANKALELLGLPAIPGSTLNADFSLDS